MTPTAFFIAMIIVYGTDGKVDILHSQPGEGTLAACLQETAEKAYDLEVKHPEFLLVESGCIPVVSPKAAKEQKEKDSKTTMRRPKFWIWPFA